MFLFFSAVTDCRRHILTSKIDPRAERIQSNYSHWLFKLWLRSLGLLQTCDTVDRKVDPRSSLLSICLVAVYILLAIVFSDHFIIFPQHS